MSRKLTLIACMLAIAPIAGLTQGASPESPSAATIAAHDETRPGDALLLSVTCECRADSGSAEIPGVASAIPLSRDGEQWRALVGIDLDAKPGAYSITAILNEAGRPIAKSERPITIAVRRFPTRRLTVAPEYVEPPPAVQRRIVEEAAVLNKLYRQVSTPSWFDLLEPPIPTKVTSNFGSRSIFNGQPRSPHAGVDFSGAVGTPVAAPAAATVMLAQDLYFTGNTVVLDHGHGLISILAHLSRIDVEKGARVERGQVVGALGSTGRVTGPHLHWSVRLHGARVDPLSVLAVFTASTSR